MTTQQQHYEGQANGTGVTVANSTTYGDSPSSSVSTTNGTVAYSSDVSMHGTRSIKLTMNSGATSMNLWNALGGISTTSCAGRLYFNLGAYPSSAVRFLSIRTSASTGAEVGGMNINPNGTIATTDTSGVYLNQSSSTTQVLALNTWYRVEMAMNVSATAGQYKTAVYAGDSTSAYYSYTSANTLNTGTTNISEIRVGHVSTAGTFANPWYLDDFAIADGTTAFLGVYTPSGPSINTSVVPGYAKLDATGSAAVNGGALTYSLSPTTGVIQPSTGIFYVPQASTASTYTLTVAESGAGTSTRSVTIPALTAASSSQTTVMTQKYVGGSWV